MHSLRHTFDTNAVTALFERFGEGEETELAPPRGCRWCCSARAGVLEAGADPTAKTSKAQLLAGRSVAKGATPQKAMLLDEHAVLELFARSR